MKGKTNRQVVTPAYFENQLYMLGLFDIGTDNGCHLHHIDSLTYF